MSVLPIAATINHLLSRQASLTSSLKTHAGKTACFDVGIVQLYLCVTGEGLLRQIEQSQLADNKPAVRIRINPTELPAILADMKQAFSHVTIEGDADFAMYCGYCAGYAWVPARIESGGVVVEAEANARRTCALKCALL